MILDLKHNSLAGGQFELPPCTKRDPYTPCNKGLTSYTEVLIYKLSVTVFVGKL